MSYGPGNSRGEESEEKYNVRLNNRLFVHELSDPEGVNQHLYDLNYLDRAKVKFLKNILCCYQKLAIRVPFRKQSYTVNDRKYSLLPTGIRQVVKEMEKDTKNCQQSFKDFKNKFYTLIMQYNADTSDDKAWFYRRDGRAHKHTKKKKRAACVQLFYDYPKSCVEKIEQFMDTMDKEIVKPTFGGRMLVDVKTGGDCGIHAYSVALIAWIMMLPYPNNNNLQLLRPSNVNSENVFAMFNVLSVILNTIGGSLDNSKILALRGLLSKGYLGKTDISTIEKTLSPKLRTTCAEKVSELLKFSERRRQYNTPNATQQKSLFQMKACVAAMKWYILELIITRLLTRHQKKHLKSYINSHNREKSVHSEQYILKISEFTKQAKIVVNFYNQAAWLKHERPQSSRVGVTVSDILASVLQEVEQKIEEACKKHLNIRQTGLAPCNRGTWLTAEHLYVLHNYIRSRLEADNKTSPYAEYFKLEACSAEALYHSCRRRNAVDVVDPKKPPTYNIIPDDLTMVVICSNAASIKGLYRDHWDALIPPKVLSKNFWQPLDCYNTMYDNIKDITLTAEQIQYKYLNKAMGGSSISHLF